MHGTCIKIKKNGLNMFDMRHIWVIRCLNVNWFSWLALELLDSGSGGTE